MSQELFPTTIIKAMIPYADTETARSLELLLQTEQVVESFQSFREAWEMRRQGDAGYGEEYELSASGMGAGQQMDLEGMIQAVQAVCSAEDGRRLNQILMLLRVKRVLSASHDVNMMFEAVTSLMGPEQKKQMDELLPLLSMMKEMQQ